VINNYQKNYTNLLSFGCSWAHGSELKPEEKTFAQLLTEKLNIPTFYKDAVASSSIPHLVVQLKDSIAKNHVVPGSTLAVFFLSGIDRDFYYSNTVEHLSIYQTDETSRTWYKHFHSQELVEYRVNTTLLALSTLCQHHGIDDRYIFGWDQLNLWDEIDRTKIFSITAKDLFTDNKEANITDLYNERNYYIAPNMGHPNQEGHKKIANSLANWLLKN
jgi:hypothetical protein